MADAVETPETTEAEVEKTPEQEADARLDEIFANMNAEPDEPEDEEVAELGGEAKKEPEPEAAKKPKAEEKEAPAPKPVSLVRYARQLGVSEGKINSLSIDALDILCDGLAEQRDAEAAAKAKEPEAVEDEDEATLKALIEEEFDPRIIGLLEKATKKTKALEAERAVEKKNAEQQRINGMIAEVDAAFADLDSPLLGGKAEGRTFDQATEEMERRNLIVRMALEKPIPGKSLRQSVKAYAKKILGIVASETPAADDPIEKRKTQYRAAATSRPTKRTEVEEPGDEAAVKAVGRWMKEAGWNDE